MTFTLSAGRRIPIAPREGWAALILVTLMCLSLALSLDDAQLVIGDPELTDFLFWTAIGGVLAGYLGAAVGWGRWRTYLIGAIFAALLVPLIVGWVLLPDGAPLGVLYQATAHAAFEAWRDLVWENRLFTSEYGHHLLVLGLLVWGSSMFAAFAAFGHRRPVNGVILIGLLLVANMSFTVRDQLPYLVLYSLSSLFLLIRFHTFDEQSDWIRRRIGDPSAIAGLYLRGGTIFIVAAVVGSLFLTKAASSAPLEGMWTNVGGRVIEWSQFLEKYLPISGSGRSIGPSFGDTARIVGVWTTNDGEALTWRPSVSIEHPPYLAAVVYDKFELQGWGWSATTGIERAAGEELLAGTADAVDTAGRRQYQATITPRIPRSVVFTPLMADRVDRPVTVQTVGADGYLGQIQGALTTDPYVVTAFVQADEKDGGPTQNQLRAAGRDYPEGMLARYGKAAVPAGSLTTPEAQALLDEIEQEAGDNPYDAASAIVDLLQDPTQFSYDTDVRDLRCQDLSIVDCFAVNRQGYCEYYASTMAILLREMDVPARVVEGFLPGKKDQNSGIYTVRNSDSHAWVQVYFPGHGWIDFDPTGGNVAALAPLPTGPVVEGPSARPTTNASRGPRPDPTLRGAEDFGPSGSVAGGPRQTPVGPFIVIAVLLAVIVGTLAAVAWRRGPRGPVTADGAYGMVTRFASRFGFAPRPNQTVYEYSGALADVLPDARPQLETVARAKVEVAYGGRQLGEDRMAALRTAQARLRTQLLRLAFRRRKWRRSR